ncbi:hypothetical protein [Streptomyces sp. AK010]|uniref:hypothetical protein n=1 Tax=Streptomyces sp. AK010 TaxID=2723074 RepID=UPI0017E7210F|nr:hypothetical protein [Streptomyces sp. AK010]MBB6421760.1 hypothetical protein [Streptomyces sp. AK010]
MARFAARRACEAAGLTALGRVAHALTALAEDLPLPPPFDDDARMWHALASDPDVPDRTVGRAVPPERPPSESADSALTSGLFQTAAPFVVGLAAAFEEPRDPSPPDRATRRCRTRSRATRRRPTRRGRTRRRRTPSRARSSRCSPSAARTRPSASRSRTWPCPPCPPPTPTRSAALDAVYAAVVTYGEDHPALLAEVRSFCEERPAPPVPRFTP